MIAWVCLIWSILAPPFKSERRLEAENAAFRQQLVVLRVALVFSPKMIAAAAAPVGACTRRY
jgi:hypothetical protein